MDSFQAYGAGVTVDQVMIGACCLLSRVPPPSLVPNTREISRSFYCVWVNEHKVPSSRLIKVVAGLRRLNTFPLPHFRGLHRTSIQPGGHAHSHHWK